MTKPDFTTPSKAIEEMIRVNHAGEYGAKRIYQGQLNYIKHQFDYTIINNMLQQEEIHLNYFNELLLQRNIRPTILLSLWHIIGYQLGSLSVLLGTKSAMLLTQSIEEVIEQHYQNQIDYLTSSNIESELLTTIRQFQAEEIEHKEIAVEQGSEEFPIFLVKVASLIKKMIKLKCSLAITLSKKI